MTCNLGSEKMPIILDNSETDANPGNQAVFHSIALSSQEHFHNDVSMSKNFKALGNNLKFSVRKDCLAPVKITEENLKKYSNDLVLPHFVYGTNELLNFSHIESKNLDELPKITQSRACKKKLKQKAVCDFGAIPQSKDIIVDQLFENKSDLDGSRGNKKKIKAKEKFNFGKKCFKMIAPHPSTCEVQDSSEKPIEKISDYTLNPRMASDDVEMEDQHMMKSNDESERGGIKLPDYPNYVYNDKRPVDVYLESTILTDFEGFNKESKVNDNLKSKNNYTTKIKCFKCFNCSFMSLSMDSLNYHTQEKDKCSINNENFHCPGCKNVFHSLTPLRVHLLHDHKMLHKEVKLILQNIQDLTCQEADITPREKSSCAFDSSNQIIHNGSVFSQSMTSDPEISIENIGSTETINKSNFVQLCDVQGGQSSGREIEPCINTKRPTMLESYLDDISNKTDCNLPPALTQNGPDLLENTFNFTAPVSEQLPSIQPPPAHSSSNSLIEHTHLMMGHQSSNGFVGMANVFPEHQAPEAYKGNEGNNYNEDNSLILQNGNYIPRQIHDIPVINLDDNHLVKPSENILPQEINIDDFPSYNENGLPPLDGGESGCRLAVEDGDQEEKKKLKKLGVGYTCDINGCKVRLQSEKNIQYHRRCHEGTLYNCPECCKDCSTWVSLSSHLWQAHKIDMELYKCDQCPYKTPSYSRLTNIHRGIHGKARPFLCDVCGKGFKTVKQMRNHKNIHKPKMVRMSVCHCEICGRTVADKRQLELHINNTHKKKKPFLCYICGYASALKQSLVVHMRRHTGEKPYECEKCEYKTTDHNALRRHKMKHSGVRNYKCNHCSYTCIQASTYKVHIKTNHPGLESDVIFACSQCSFQTLNRGSFLSHTSGHENYNAQVRKQVRCNSGKQSNEQEYYNDTNRMNLVNPIMTERVVETIVDLSSAQNLLEDDYYERITGDLENAHELKFKSSEIT